MYSYVLCVCALIIFICYINFLKCSFKYSFLCRQLLGAFMPLLYDFCMFIVIVVLFYKVDMTQLPRSTH